jgi:hypothetical protein
MKRKYDGHTGGHKAPHLGHPLDDALANWIEKHADYLASGKCVWWVKYHATDIAGVLLPEAAAYDSLQANYLEARLKAMGHDIILLEQGMGDLAKRLIEAYRNKGKWTDEEGMDAQVVGNLINRLRDYGVFDDEADPELDDAIYQDLTHREREKLGAK